MTTKNANRLRAYCEHCGGVIPPGEGERCAPFGVKERAKLHSLWVHQEECAAGYAELLRWMAAAAHAELTVKGRNPDRLTEGELLEAARCSSTLTMLSVTPFDGLARHVNLHPQWDVEALPEQGWKEYPAPGRARVFVRPDTGAATVHPVDSFFASPGDEKKTMRSNTVCGQYVVLDRVGKLSAQLVATMLESAAPTLDSAQDGR
ncbi:hypothetical protein ACFFR3_45745 [Nonomuraea salmonea]|uniref:Uncharacterized protein n=1 Tax=Nonomuraea salmonea TaxID=46181 RepID=A0ABV5P2P1_9ACTN